MMLVSFKRTLDSQQIFFAVGESLSHPNYLRTRGKLKREARPDGLYRCARV
jgi:hypothetical protein